MTLSTLQSRLPLPANDDEQMNFCSTCAFSSACLSEGQDKASLSELHCLVEHVGPFRPGQTIFREGEPFKAIAAVRAGTVKSNVIDASGREHVLGFFLPGDVIGLNAIHGESYPCNAVALDTVMLCRFSFPMMSTLAQRVPGLQKQLFRLLSQDIGKAYLLVGDYRSEERVAAFLVMLSQRYSDRGYSPRRFALTMTRTDIANYLRLASETVSRVLRRFQDDGLIKVDLRDVEILDLAGLSRVAEAMLRH